MTPEPEGAPRPLDPLEYERRFWGRGLWVAGVDEAGRGPLAGPVVAAAVILPTGMLVTGADDSKRLSPEVREDLFYTIQDAAEWVGVGAASAREIDRLNILNATTLAMKRALEGVKGDAVAVVVDGNPVRGLGVTHEAVVGGDGRVHSIACASIVAKVVRDRLMMRLAARYPEYGWERNMGYGTPEHLEALRRLGPTPHHRVTFGGVQFELDL
ncbi:MAG: ribonuclease HII [Gemmatimonadota bacterium]